MTFIDLSSHPHQNQTHSILLIFSSRNCWHEAGLDVLHRFFQILDILFSSLMSTIVDDDLFIFIFIARHRTRPPAWAGTVMERRRAAYSRSMR